MTEFPNMTDLPGPVVVTRDGIDVSEILPDSSAALRWLHRHQGMSASWALKFEGYGVRSVGAEPWPEAERRQCRRNSTAVFGGDSFRSHGHEGYDDDVTLMNCGECALRGYGENSEGGALAPNYSGWARLYVEAGRPVPEKYRAGFTLELNDENRPYADALARDLATWGVSFADS